MKDKTSKRIQIDYKELIKGHGLWRVYRRYKKHFKNNISDKRKMYCFCMEYLRSELLSIKQFYNDTEFSMKNRSLGWEDWYETF